MRFAPSNHWIAAGWSDGTAVVFERLTGRVAHTLEALAKVRDIAFSDDGNRVAFASADGLVRVLDTSNWGLTTLGGHEGRVASVGFAPDGALFSTGFDGTVRVWLESRSTPLDQEALDRWLALNTSAVISNVSGKIRSKGETGEEEEEEQRQTPLGPADDPSSN